MRAYGFFPAEWNFGDKPTDGYGNKPVEDAGTIYIVVDVNCGNNEDSFERDEMFIQKTSINEIVDYTIDGLVEGNGRIVGEHRKNVNRIRESLILAIERIDEALNRSAE